MGMFNDSVRAQTKEVLGEMCDPVGLTYFSQEIECDPCGTATQFLEELAGLDERIVLTKKDFLKDRELAEKMDIHHIPAFALSAPGGRFPLRYYGIPSGYEFGAFLRALVLYSTGTVVEKIDTARLEGIDKEINIKVFVLVTCPSCPVMAYLAATLAWLSPKITTEIIETNGFVDLSNRFSVSTVPKIVINDTVEMTGVIPPEELTAALMSL
jgi:glutaredoxin-like protein